MLDGLDSTGGRHTLIEQISLTAAIPTRSINPICVTPYTRPPQEAVILLKQRNSELIKKLTAISAGLVSIDDYTSLRDMEDVFIENYCLACAHAQFSPFIVVGRLGLCMASWFSGWDIFLKVESVVGNFADKSVVELARFYDAAFRPDDLGDACTKIVLSSRTKTSKYGVTLLSNFCSSLTSSLGNNPLYVAAISALEAVVRGFINVTSLMSSGLGIEALLDKNEIPTPVLESNSGVLNVARSFASNSVHNSKPGQPRANAARPSRSAPPPRTPLRTETTNTSFGSAASPPKDDGAGAAFDD